MFFNMNSIILFFAGLLFFIFARRIAGFILSRSPKNKFQTPLQKRLLFIWPTRVMGIMCLTFAVLIALSGPVQSSLKKGSNQLLLLEKGALIKAIVSKVVYQRIAPAGWEVIYKFEAKDPINKNVKDYVGSSQGPKKYYMGLSKGDDITVIYDPCMPKLNCEIRRFLNYPGYRHTFKKVGKLNLLDKFKDEFELEDYTFEKWYRQQQTR